MLEALAIVLERPEHIALNRLALTAPEPDDVVVKTLWSGISTGTERLLFTGRMPSFPGMGYPLVPGYESVGVVTQAGPGAHVREGEMVFVPGARCFGEVRGLFGGAALTFSGPSSLTTTTSTGHERSRVTLDLHVGQALASRVNWRVGIYNLGDAPLSRSRQYSSSGQQITDLSRTLTGPRVFASVGAQF